MRGDAVGAGLDRDQRGAHRIGPLARPGVTQGGDVIDIDSEAQRRSLDIRTLGKFAAIDDPHPEERPLGRVSKDETCILSHGSRRAQERAPHHEEAFLSIDAVDPCDDGLGAQLGDDSAEMLQVIDLEIDGEFGEVGRAPATC